MTRKLMMSVILTAVLAGWGGTAAAATVHLYGFKTISGQPLAAPAAGVTVKFCDAASNWCGQTELDGYGFVTTGLPYAGNYYIYLYGNYYNAANGGEWGSLTQPLAGGTFYVPNGSTSITVSTPPRPLPPTLISPCNHCYVPSSNFYLRWTNGLDAQRQNYPVTYDIWASETPVGWAQQPEHVAVADAPCNPDAQGNCRWYVDALIPEPGRTYTWRIVVKLHVGNNIIFTTSGPSWRITQY
ncbi:MAG TPA: hypothetical protein VE010_06380 [Thermoanaerobaculia bacterium]|nr:hypothetical protein [Thermoanaerobaculia bacterium]